MNTNLKLLVLPIIASTLLQSTPTRANEPDKGVNRKIFGVLCASVNAQGKLKLAAKASGETLKTATDAGHLSLYMAHPEAIEKLSKIEETGSKPDGSYQTLPEACQGQKLASCKAAARHIKGLPSIETNKIKAAADKSNLVASKVNATLNKIKSLMQQKKDFFSSSSGATAASAAEQALAKALYGATGRAEALRNLGSGSNRAGLCGTGATTTGTAATQSLAATLICVCASDGTTGGGNTGCFGTQTTNLDFTGSPVNGATVWTEIAGKCKTETPAKEQYTASDLDAVVLSIEQSLHEPHGNDGKIGYLGATESGNGAGSCDGDVTTGKGACAFFQGTGDAPGRPEWLAHLKTAAREQRTSEDINAINLLAEAQIQSLNESLTDLLQLKAIPTQQVAVRNNPAETADTEKALTVEHKEKECKAAGENKIECDKLEKQGCTFNEKDKKCEIKKDVKEKLEKEGQENRRERWEN